ncbi:hypothetical protein NDS46_30080 (plasmid) [Paenibacillus thiaminolyticus]|uniref:hypothetical protein n=1 Tax=Paenibacillus thiaminolyticus TaxID=49283 RepID=UPI00232B151F|nr:hypothetical protein [Paenibacillus thiaminolyticus]WCF11596.1 hypothetical protein NDS46_30080 [Paenibacillus thiaminolyticus]
MSNDYLTLSTNTKENVLQELRHLLHATRSLIDDISQDQLTQHQADMMVGLLEFYQADIGKLLGYDSVLARERKERYKEVQLAYQRVSELEKMIGSNREVDGLKEQLGHLYEVINEWWNDKGFYHISNYRYYSTGVIGLSFCFMLDYKYSRKRNPENGELNKEEYMCHLRSLGYEVVYLEGYGLHLLDVQVNRKLLKTLIQSRFPSSKIERYQNRSIGGDDEYNVLQALDVTIESLHDVV